MNLNLIDKLIKEEIRKVLLEVTMEQAEARFNSKAFQKAAIRANEMFGYKLPAELDLLMYACIKNVKDSISRDIPERFKADALLWVISTFIKTNKFGAVGDRKKALETFFQIKEAGKGSILTKSDINKIQSWDELEEVVTQAKPAWEEHKKDKSDADAEAGTNKIYEDDNWKVFIPENKGAACELGKGTDWCTASPGLDYYEHYHKPEEGDPLIIFYSKKESFKRKVKEYNKKTKTWDLVQKTFPKKYQFSYGSDQFMDWNKPERSIKENPLFYKLNQIVKSLTDKLPEQVIKKADQWSYEELPDGGYKVSVPNEIKYYNKDGQPHRLDGPAYEGAGGTKEWYQMGERHRLDGPAVEWANGTKGWYQNNKLHRLDGPAVEWANGHKSWYIEGKSYSEQAFNQKVKELKAQQDLREHFMRYL